MPFGNKQFLYCKEAVLMVQQIENLNTLRYMLRAVRTGLNRLTCFFWLLFIKLCWRSYVNKTSKQTLVRIMSTSHKVLFIIKCLLYAIYCKWFAYTIVLCIHLHPLTIYIKFIYSPLKKVQMEFLLTRDMKIICIYTVVFYLLGFYVHNDFRLCLFIKFRRTI